MFLAYATRVMRESSVLTLLVDGYYSPWRMLGGIVARLRILDRKEFLVIQHISKEGREYLYLEKTAFPVCFRTMVLLSGKKTDIRPLLIA